MIDKGYLTDQFQIQKDSEQKGYKRLHDLAKLK